MSETLLQMLKNYICYKFGHFPGKTWKYEDYQHTNCKCCGKLIIKFYGTWE